LTRWSFGLRPPGGAETRPALKERVAGTLYPVSEELSERWWLRIRRAFGVPDLVTDYHAKVLIIDQLTPPLGMSVLLDPEPAIDCLLQAASDLGGTSYLDDLLLYSVDGWEQRLAISEKLGLPDTPQIRLLARTAADPYWPAMHEAIGQSLMDELKPIVLRLLETVSENIREDPCELPGRSTWLTGQTSEGGYVTAPSGADLADALGASSDVVSRWVLGWR
jgi:hypothetical protein